MPTRKTTPVAKKSSLKASAKNLYEASPAELKAAGARVVIPGKVLSYNVRKEQPAWATLAGEPGVVKTLQGLSTILERAVDGLSAGDMDKVYASLWHLALASDQARSTLRDIVHEPELARQVETLKAQGRPHEQASLDLRSAHRRISTLMGKLDAEARVKKGPKGSAPQVLLGKKA